MSSDVFPGTRLLERPEYTFLVEDLRTKRIVAEYPLKSVKYNNLIKGIGKLSGTVKLTPEIMRQDPKRTLVTGIHGIYVLRNNEPVWAGILMVTEYDEGSNRLSITANTYELWFDRRINTRDINVKRMDQIDIARLLVNTGNAASTMGIEVDTVTKSGFLRERNAYAYELNTIWDELSRLSNLLNGFDFRIEPYRDEYSSELKKRLIFGYPYLSNTTEDNPIHLFESGRNLTDVKVTFSSDDSAMRVYAIGEGEGPAQKVAIADDTVLLGYGYPRYESSLSKKGVKEHTTLVSHAHQHLAEIRNPIVEIQGKIRGGAEPYVGSYSPGDWVKVRIENIWFPEGYERTLRITDIDVTLQENGAEVVDLKFTGPNVRDALIIDDSVQLVDVPKTNESSDE